MTDSPEQLFAERLRRDPSRPFVTYYDEDTGERSELSARSLANWVAKTHHLLVDELSLGPGDAAVLALPMHWIGLGPLLACLTAGLSLAAHGPADVAFGVPGASLDAPDRFLVAPGSARTGFGAAPVPDGAVDYVAAVRPHEDSWASVRFAAADGDPCWDGSSRAQAAARARERAAELGLAGGARVLCTRGWGGPADWLDTVFAPLAVGGSVVYVHGGSPQVLARRAEQERVTAQLS
ncbi:MAG: TIGR03089 family protein [Jatrophihabitans sp.]|nr:MAG: TIGR03089 family protein [Jatrophihabitans sp.]